MSKMTDKEIVDWIISCREEAHEAKTKRNALTRDNFNEYHMEHDFSHKEEGQSTEVLARQTMSVEQIKSFFQQSLADLGDWWKCEPNYSQNELNMLIKPNEITKLTNYFLTDSKYFAHVGDSIQSALLASLNITKTSGELKAKPRFVAKKGRGNKYSLEKVEDKAWKLKHDVIRAENYFPDPTGKGLYEVEQYWPDHFELVRQAEEDEDYNLQMIKDLPDSGGDIEEQTDKARETGQDAVIGSHRPKPKVTEFWGTILNKKGEICYENVQAIVVNDTYLVMSPRPNPLWHQKSPYTTSPLIRVANSVWHKALMDAPTKHSHSLIELYNLLVDAAMQQVHAIKQLRKDAVDNPAQLQNGIKYGATINVNSLLPPGAKVLEAVTAVQIPPEVLNIFNIMSQEFNSSSLTNDLRSGVMPFRAVKATEVVEASQTITSVFQGMAKNWEAQQSMPELEMSWMTVAQNWDLIDPNVFTGLFGDERGRELAALQPAQVFAATVGAINFKVYGISLTLSKANDFRKLTTLLQTVFSNPALTELFMQKYDPGMMLGEIMTSLDIDKSKLELPKAVQNSMAQPQEGAPVEGPDMNSQVPQAGAGSMGDLLGQPEMPQASFPGSSAIQGMSTR